MSELNLGGTEEEVYLEFLSVDVLDQGSDEASEGEVKTNELLAQSVITRSFSYVFQDSLVKPHLVVSFTEQKQSEVSEELPFVESYIDALDCSRFGVNIFSELPTSEDVGNPEKVMDLFNTLTVELLVLKETLDGRLVYNEGREVYNGVDVTDVKLHELPYMVKVMGDLEALSLKFAADIAVIFK